MKVCISVFQLLILNFQHLTDRDQLCSIVFYQINTKCILRNRTPLVLYNPISIGLRTLDLDLCAFLSILLWVLSFGPRPILSPLNYFREHSGNIYLNLELYMCEVGVKCYCNYFGLLLRWILWVLSHQFCKIYFKFIYCIERNYRQTVCKSRKKLNFQLNGLFQCC